MQSTTQQTTRILYIDGNKDSSERFKESFSDQFSIIHSDDHTEAFVLLKRENFDLILTNNLNACFNEKEFFSILDTQHPNIPVLYFTENRENISHAFGTGRIIKIIQNPNLNYDKKTMINLLKNAINRAKMEETLKQEGTVLQKLIELNPYGIAFYDTEGHYITANKAFFDLFKITPEHYYALVDIPLFENPVLVNADVNEFYEKFKKNDYVSFGPIYYNSRMGGPEFPDNPVYISAIAFKLENSYDNSENIAVMLEDITERVNAENELNKTLEELEDRIELRTTELSSTNRQLFDEIKRRIDLEKELKFKNRELEEFAYKVAHDLRNRIIAFDRIIEIARRNPERISESLDLLSETSRKASHFVEKLLNQAKTGMVISEMQPFAIEKLVDYVFSRTKPAECNARLTIQDFFPPVNCDPIAMEQVFQNLVSNSFQYADPEKGSLKIELKYTISDDVIVITYSDNGLGIDDKNITKVFNLLFTTNPKENYGLGLSIVKKIIESHNGRITVESTGTGKGTSFVITMPLNSALSEA
jgi:signal transduction histidine kinase